MRYLLDTCVLSEARHNSGDPGVRAALRQTPPHEVLIASITVAEIVKGIAKLPEGRRKAGLWHWCQALMNLHADRIVPMDTDIAERTGRLSAEAEGRGTPVPLADAIIAATALRHGVAVMTRNVRHFALLRVPVFNPWSGA